MNCNTESRMFHINEYEQTIVKYNTICMNLETCNTNCTKSEYIQSRCITTFQLKCLYDDGHIRLYCLMTVCVRTCYGVHI